MRLKRAPAWALALLVCGAGEEARAGRLAGGYNHSLIVDDSGVSWGVGRNSKQLGDNTGPDRSLPAPAPNLPPLQAVATGANFSLFLTTDGTVWCAGGTVRECGPLGGGPVQPTIAFTGASAVAGALYHVVALRPDGTVWSWGTHANTLGDGVTTTSSTPVQVQGLTGVTAIATSWYHSLAVTSDGRVWAWGANSYGQLGDGTTTARSTPVLVPGIDNVVAVATARFHSLALRADGSVWAWGDNSCGKLGDGTTTSHITPAPTAGPGDVAQIAGGEAYSVVRTTAGEVWVWGANPYGQLGEGASTACRPLPQRVQALSGVVDIAAAQAHVLARTATGEVWSWGNNSFGQLGDGTKVQRRWPVQISLAGFTWKTGTPELAPRGGSFSAATNVTLTCATPAATIRYTLDDSEPDASSPSVASGSTLALTQSATLRVRAWSAGQPPSNLDQATFSFNFGTLAAPTFDRAPGAYVAPLNVTLAGPPVATLRYTLDGSTPTSGSAAYSSPLALTASATLRARAEAPDWNPSPVTSATYTLQAPAPVFDPGGGSFVNDVVVTLRTPPFDWLGLHYSTDGTAPDTADPFALSGSTLTLSAPTPLAAIAVGPGLAPSTVTAAVYDFAAATPVPTPPPGLYSEPLTVALHSASAGSTIRYTLDGSEPTEASPAYTVPLGVAATTHLKARAFRAGWPPSPVVSAHYVIRQPGDLAAGQAFSVAIDATGVAWTWGDNQSGQLGDGSTLARPYVARVPGLSGLARVAAGRAHVLALGLDGRVWSWGDNAFGQLGDGGTLARATPAPIQGLTDIVAIACGARHSLAVDAGGRVWAWGDGAAGQLGLGAPSSSLTPQIVEELPDVVALAAGDAHSLALAADGQVWAWGDDSHGQLGNGAAGSSVLPQAVAGLDEVISIAAGARHSLAVRADGTVAAWGDDGDGQLGRGDATPTDVPGDVWAAICTPDGCAGSVPLGDATAVAAGARHSLARRGDGSLWGWGDNTRGALLDHTGVPLARPLLAPPDVRLLASGGAHAAVVGASDEVLAWGANEAGQAGDGGHDDAFEAQSLALPAFVWRTPPVAFSAGSGVYTEEQQVTLACAMPAAEVRYTLDGSPPSEASPLVPPGGVAVTEGATLRAAAWAADYAGSVVRSADYVFLVGTPTLDPPGGEYGAAQTVHASVDTPEAQTLYTLDDTSPSASSPVFPSEGLTLERRARLRVQARRPGWLDGDEVAAMYAFRVAAPTFNPAGGELSAATDVTLASPTLGAVVRVTEDGGTPDLEAPLVTGPRRVARSTTLNARAFKAGWLPSPTASATYTLAAGAVPAPRIQPRGGRFATAPVVTLLCDEPGLALRVTLTGVDPTPADSTLACGATIALAGSVSVKVRAWRGADSSAIARADFAVTGAVASGRAHSLALGADGRVWAWGDNAFGQLGLGQGGDSPTPQLVPGLTDVVAIAAGDDHSLALARDGSVWAWGDNSRGQLGDGTMTPRSTPVLVPVSGLLALAAGAQHTLALRSDGTLLAWGWDEGAFGNGTPTLGSLVPVPAAGGLANLARIAVGDGFSLAVDRGGAVWTWGRNTSGELGNGSTAASLIPLAVPDVAGVTLAAAGQTFALAARSDGTGRADLWSWGRFPFGGTRPQASLSDVTALDAGGFHALALRAGGRVWAWGDGESGQLGDGGLSGVDAPQLVPGVRDIVAVAGGGQHTLALHADGSVWAWGGNADGQLGDGSNARRATPARVPGLALASNAWLTADPDADGLSTGAELQLGSDPLDPDTNSDGVRDGDAAAMGLSLTDPDMDADGLSNRDEIALGTDPFDPDSDDDGVRDGLDAFPLDPGRWEPLPPDPGDHTPPSITLLQPAGAVLLSTTP